MNGIDIQLGDEKMDFLENLYLIRNAIVHAHGSIDGVDKSRTARRL